MHAPFTATAAASATAPAAASAPAPATATHWYPGDTHGIPDHCFDIGHVVIYNVEMEATELELAYLAGIMDGDGCFALFHYKGRNRGRFSLEVFTSIKQTQHEALDLLAYIFGGTVRLTKPSSPGGKLLYLWKRSGTHAADVATQLLPYLRLKKRQAEIVIACQEEITRERFRELGPPQEAHYSSGVRLVRRFGISDASLVRRMTWLQEMRALNDTRYPI